VVIRAVKRENGRSRDVAWVPFGGWAMGFAIEIIRVRVGGARLGRAWFGGGGRPSYIRTCTRTNIRQNINNVIIDYVSFT
jgi:hypothetical protein